MGPVPYAGFGSRLLAVILDGLASAAAAIPVIFLVVIMLAAGPRQTYTSTDAEGVVSTTRGPTIAMILLTILVGLVGFLGFQVWNHVLRVSRTGQSVGKKALGIKVVSAETGAPIGTGQALGRWLFAWLISGNFCYLGYLWTLWDPKKQTWHDKVVGSIVITQR